MEDEDGQPRWEPSEPATVTVTPMLGETGVFDQPIDTPVVALGNHHHDHSDDDESKSADSLIDLSSPMPPSKCHPCNNEKEKDIPHHKIYCRRQKYQ
jgi:hypothetical protein